MLYIVVVYWKNIVVEWLIEKRLIETVIDWKKVTYYYVCQQYKLGVCQQNFNT